MPQLLETCCELNTNSDAEGKRWLLPMFNGFIISKGPCALDALGFSINSRVW